MKKLVVVVWTIAVLATTAAADTGPVADEFDLDADETDLDADESDPVAAKSDPASRIIQAAYDIRHSPSSRGKHFKVLGLCCRIKCNERWRADCDRWGWTWGEPVDKLPDAHTPLAPNY